MNANLTLNELIEQLTDLRDAYRAGDAVVRVAFQPNYPLAATLAETTLVVNERGRERTVWLAASTSVPSYTTPAESPYAPSQAWDGDLVDLDEYADDDATQERIDAARRERT